MLLLLLLPLVLVALVLFGLFLLSRAFLPRRRMVTPRPTDPLFRQESELTPRTGRERAPVSPRSRQTVIEADYTMVE